MKIITMVALQKEVMKHFKNMTIKKKITKKQVEKEIGHELPQNEIQYAGIHIHSVGRMKSTGVPRASIEVWANNKHIECASYYYNYTDIYKAIGDFILIQELVK